MARFAPDPPIVRLWPGFTAPLPLLAVLLRTLIRLIRSVLILCTETTRDDQSTESPQIHGTGFAVELGSPLGGRQRLQRMVEG